MTPLRRVGGHPGSETSAIRLQRYILRELLAAFLLLFAIVTAVVGAGLLLQFLHRAPQIGLIAIAKGLPYVLPVAFPITIPLAFLVACLLTYGRFADDNEFTALRMGGVHPWHAVAPAVVVGAVLSMGTVFLNTDVLPWAELGQREILKDQVQRIITALEEGSATVVPLGKASGLSAEGRDADGAFRAARISTGGGEEGRRAGPVGLFSGGEIVARRAWLWLDDERDALIIRLQDAVSVQGDVTVEFDDTTIAVDLDRLVGASAREEAKSESLMTAEELRYNMARPSPDDVQNLEYAAELWHRIAMGLAPLVFGFLGAPLGLWSARGSRGSAFLLALVVALPVYYPLLRLGENLAREGTLPPAPALLLGDVLLLAAGGWFLVRVVRA